MQRHRKSSRNLGVVGSLGRGTAFKLQSKPQSKQASDERFGDGGKGRKSPDLRRQGSTRKDRPIVRGRKYRNKTQYGSAGPPDRNREYGGAAYSRNNPVI